MAFAAAAVFGVVALLAASLQGCDQGLRGEALAPDDPDKSQADSGESTADSGGADTGGADTGGPSPNETLAPEDPDDKNQADAYLWPASSTLQRCTDYGSLPSEERYLFDTALECQQQAVANGHSFFQYAVDTKECATVAACDAPEGVGYSPYHVWEAPEAWRMLDMPTPTDVGDYVWLPHLGSAPGGGAFHVDGQWRIYRPLPTEACASVTLYEHDHFSGWNATFGIGSHRWLGDFEDYASSIVIHGHCRVTLYQDGDLQGWHRTIVGPGTFTQWYLHAMGVCNDRTSSLKVEAAHQGETPSPLVPPAQEPELESCACAKMGPGSPHGECIPCSRFGMRDGCWRWDTTVIASMIFTPWHTCGEGGECGEYMATDVCGRWYPQQQSSCWVYNKGEYLPHNGREGHCIPLHMKSWSEHDMKANCHEAWTRSLWLKGAYQWAHDTRKGYDDDGIVLRCADDSFCKGYGAASGEVGDCSCACTREAVEEGKHERCTTVPADMCTDDIWCNGAGEAAKLGDGDQVGCSCWCGAGHSGARCEKKDWEPCDWTDCSGHGWALSGNRSNCECDCVGCFGHFPGWGQQPSWDERKTCASNHWWSACNPQVANNR